MALRVLCHYCRSTINIAEHLRGRAIRCPYCQQATKVPGAQPQVRRPQPLPAQRMGRPAQPVVVPALPDRVTRMPPPRTHFEGVDVPDHVYQEPVVEESVQFEILQRPESHLQDYDLSSAAATEDYDDVPMPLESRKRRSSPLFWLGVFLLAAVLVGAAAAAGAMYVNGWSFDGSTNGR